MFDYVTHELPELIESEMPVIRGAGAGPAAPLLRTAFAQYHSLAALGVGVGLCHLPRLRQQA